MLDKPIPSTKYSHKAKKMSEKRKIEHSLDTSSSSSSFRKITRLSDHEHVLERGEMYMDSMDETTVTVDIPEPYFKQNIKIYPISEHDVDTDLITPIKSWKRYKPKPNDIVTKDEKGNYGLYSGQSITTQPFEEHLLSSIDYEMKRSDVTYSPALLKLFNEITTNAADQSVEHVETNNIKVTIHDDDSISVWNNGIGMDLNFDTDNNCYVPTLAFGTLRSSSSFGQKGERMTGETGSVNGIGSSLTNIYSQKFKVVVTDGKQKFTQVWTKNMYVVGTPEITKCSQPPSVCITFLPDYSRLGLPGLTEGNRKMITRSVFDLSGTTSKRVTVQLNNFKIKAKCFKDYVKMFLDTENNNVIYEDYGKWSVCVSQSRFSSFESISYVNNICTRLGGTHVDYVTDLVAKELVDICSKGKNKVSKHICKNQLSVFLNCKVKNPLFNSQVKEVLRTKKSKLFDGNESFTLSESFVRKLSRSDIVDAIKKRMDNSILKDLKDLSGKKTKNVKGIIKLDDANHAGKKNNKGTTLYLSEGDSAKTFVVAGLSVIGRDKNGVFPLKGKLANVREFLEKKKPDIEAIKKNKEIGNLFKIIGLKYGEKYTDTKQLRYESITICTDADLDGYHITCLLINFFHVFWPELLGIKGFIKLFITPLILVKNHNLEFFTPQSFEEFKRTTHLKNLDTKYYKGLGTWEEKQIKKLFERHHEYVYDLVYDQKMGQLVNLVFSKKLSDQRKRWMNEYDPNQSIDLKHDYIKLDEYFNTNLREFAIQTLTRAIPSVVDGLKESYRKVLFAVKKKKSNEEIKVSQLAGYVAENSAYHHGEDSLSGTIISMARSYVGSKNNVPLLLDNGNFGSRIASTDASSPRYIFSCLSNIANVLYKPDDEPYLIQQYDNKRQIEPKFYVPILPTILMNSAGGLATGWSSWIQSYNPIDVAQMVKDILNDKNVPDHLTPFHLGYKGKIEQDGNKNVTETGVVSFHKQFDNGDVQVIIEEIPASMYIASLKEQLAVKLEKNEIISVIDRSGLHTPTTYVRMSNATYNKHKDDMISFFGLEKKINIVLVAMDSQNKVKKYKNEKEIVHAFMTVRKEYYRKRIEGIIHILNQKIDTDENMIKFITLLQSGKINMINRPKTDIENDLVLHNIYKIDNKYDYIFNKNLGFFTKDKINKFEKEVIETKKKLEYYKHVTVKEIWIKEIDEFLTEYKKLQKEILNKRSKN